MRAAFSNPRLRLGLFSLALGGLLLAAEQNPAWKQELAGWYLWPKNLIAAGALLALLALLLNKPGLMPVATVAAGWGGIVYYQAVLSAYGGVMWVLLPGFIGLGLFLRGLFWRAQRRYYLKRGLYLIAISGILLLLAALALGGFKRWSDQLPAWLLILLGLYLVVQATRTSDETV